MGRSESLCCAISACRAAQHSREQAQSRSCVPAWKMPNSGFDMPIVGAGIRQRYCMKFEDKKDGPPVELAVDLSEV
jgi:hypothetical protein